MEQSRVRVEGSPTRCPYCHDEAGAEDSVACVACLARHHAGCWEEAARCAACGHGERLARATPAAPPAEAPPIVTTFDVLRALAPGAFKLGTLVPSLLALIVVYPLVVYLARNDHLAMFRVFFGAPVLVLWAHGAAWLVAGERRRLLVVLSELAGARWTLFLAAWLLPLWAIWASAGR